VAEKFKGDGSDIAVDEALKFIGRAVEKKKPFLAVVWFGNPHSPHRALPDDLKTADGSAYYGEIVGIDRAVGRMRSELRKLGVADNTLVLFCSDNGGTKAGSVGGLRGNKGSVWEGGVRVPGIIEWPAVIKKPAVTDVPACTSDIYPTVLDILGIKVPNQVEPLDGISLLPLLENRMPERPRPIGFWHFPGGKDFTKAGGNAAWTDNQYKLVKLGPDRYELYDLTKDQTEKNDLAADKPGVVARMKAGLDAWQDSVLRSYRGEDYKSADGGR
jgi:arylsulfatase A-like enzyme